MLPRGFGSDVVRPIHIIVLTLCMLINILDGFDLQAIAFTSTRIMAEWSVAPGGMGLLFSAGLLGVGLGSFGLSPLADRFGRRPTILAGLAVVTVGMLAVRIATTPVELTLLRLTTGLGIGILLPSLNTLVSEYTPERWQSLAVGIYSTGYPLGGALSGALAPGLIEHFGWRSVYVAGGSGSLVLLPLVTALLPESLEFLLKLQPRGALRRAQRIATRLAVTPPARLPAAQALNVRPNPSTPFKAGLARRTGLISAAFFLLWLTEFFINNWTPAILEREGLGPVASAAGGVMLTLGGIAGTLLVGVFAVRWPLVRVCVAYLGGSFVMALVFALAGRQLPVLPVCAVLGFLLFGSAVGLYALVARVFPLEVRATGTGVALAFGRAGAVIGLSLGGVLIGLGWSRATYMTVLAIPVLGAACATFALNPFARAADGRA